MSAHEIRWSGVALTGGGAYTLIFGLRPLGAVLILAGLVGLYALQRERIGRLGLAGLLIAGIGLLGFGAIGVWRWFSPEWTLSLSVTLRGAVIALALGLILFGRATNRAAIMPRHSGTGLIIAALMIVLTGVGIHAFGLCLVWLGYSVLRGNYTVAAPTRTARAAPTYNPT